MTPDERKKLLTNLREYPNELTFDGLLAFDAADEIERLVKERDDIEKALRSHTDASAGLIEAAEWHKMKATEYGPLPEYSDTAKKALQIFQHWHMDCAEALRSLAADRSGK